MKIADIPVPEIMGRLKRDPRGFPIPAFATRTKDKRAHFDVVDAAKRQKLIAKDKCFICGTKLLLGRYFVGGPASGLGVGGLYSDAPSHEACARYAMQACPYIAAPIYSKRLDGRSMIDDPDKMVILDPLQIVQRPKYFVVLRALGQENLPAKGVYCEPGMVETDIRFIRPRQVQEVHVWHEGREVMDAAGLTAFCAWAEDYLAKRGIRQTFRTRRILYERLRALTRAGDIV